MTICDPYVGHAPLYNNIADYYFASLGLDDVAPVSHLKALYSGAVI